MQDTIGTSDGRLYDVDIQILTDPALMVSKTVVLHLQPRLLDEQSLGLRVNYLRQFMLKNQLSDSELINDARGEVVIFLETDREDWENPESNIYTRNKM